MQREESVKAANRLWDLHKDHMKPFSMTAAMSYFFSEKIFLNLLREYYTQIPQGCVSDRHSLRKKGVSKGLHALTPQWACLSAKDPQVCQLI